MVDSSSIALGIIGVLLVASVGASNAVVAGQRTVLDQGFVTDKLAEEGVYETMEERFVETVAGEIGNATDGQSGDITETTLNATAIADDAITTTYIRNQTETNVGRIYDYLHGRTDDLVLEFDLRPLKASLSDAIGDSVGNVRLSAVVEQGLDAYEGDVPFEPSLVDDMTRSQADYRDAREEFRDDIRESVLDDMANETYEDADTERDHDQLLALVIEDYDPRDYTAAEKRRMVAERESEIKAAIKDRVVEERGDELDERIEEAITDRHENVRENVSAATRDATSDRSDAFTEAAVDLNTAVVDGLMGDITFDEFSTRVEDARSRLAEEAEAVARRTVEDEVPAVMDASEQFGNGTADTFRSARGGVGIADLLGWLLPLLSLGLVGLAYVASRSLERTARTTGVAALTAGLAGFVAALIAQGPVAGMIDRSFPEEQETMADAVLGIFGDVFGTLAAQSLMLVVVGGVLVGLVLANQYGYLDRFRDSSPDRLQDGT